jgi:hypothetical protein
MVAEMATDVGFSIVLRESSIQRQNSEKHYELLESTLSRNHRCMVLRKPNPTYYQPARVSARTKTREYGAKYITGKSCPGVIADITCFTVIRNRKCPKIQLSPYCW